MENGNEIDDLIKLISKLPGLGPKSAKRIVLKLINNRDELVKPLAKSLADVYKNISRCKICGALKSISIECGLQNGTLAIFVGTALFGGGVYIVPAATYSLIMFLTSLIFVFIVRKI